MKLCSKCKAMKPVSEFSKRKRSADGLNYYCKKCQKVMDNTSYRKNKEKRLADGRRWVSNNRERNTAYQAAWKAAHKKELKEYFANRYIEKRESILKASSIREANRYANDPEFAAKVKRELVRWRKENPEKFLAQAANRRARMKNAEGSHTAEEVIALFKFQKGKCAACKASIRKKYHKDHIAPLEPRNGGQRGSNYIRNIQLLCPKCNSKKAAKPPIQFMQEMGYLL